MSNEQTQFKDIIQENTQKIINFIDSGAIIDVLDKSKDDENKIFWVRIESKEPGFLIGQKGSNLKALQHLVSLISCKNQKDDRTHKTRIIIDVNNYRVSRLEFLKKIALINYKKVTETRRVVLLEPMSAYERRVIHLTLQEKKEIETESLGDEPNRRVMIRMKKI